MTPAADSDDFADYAHNIPLSLKTNDRLYIDMLRRHFPVLTEVPAFSGNSLFRFDGNEWKRENAATPRPRGALTRIAGRVSKALGAIAGMPGHLTRTEEHESAALVIRILEKKHFDRPLYNKRLLRRLFSAYRHGNGAYHKLFTLVFYIELWHLLFVDEDSSLLFDPRNTKLPGPEIEQEH